MPRRHDSTNIRSCQDTCSYQCRRAGRDRRWRDAAVAGDRASPPALGDRVRRGDRRGGPKLQAPPGVPGRAEAVPPPATRPGAALGRCAGPSRPTTRSAAGSPPARCPSWSTRSASSGCGATTAGRQRIAALVAGRARGPAQADDERPLRQRRASARGRRAGRGADPGRARRPAGPPRATARRQPPSAACGTGDVDAEAARAELAGPPAVRHANDRAEAARAAWRRSRRSATLRRSGRRRPSVSATTCSPTAPSAAASRCRGAQVAELRDAGRLSARPRRPAGRPGRRRRRRRGVRSLPGGVARDSRRRPSTCSGARRARARRRVQRRQAGLARRGPGRAAGAGCSTSSRPSPAASAATSLSCSTAPTWSAPTPSRRTVAGRLLAGRRHRRRRDPREALGATASVRSSSSPTTKQFAVPWRRPVPTSSRATPSSNR